MANVGGRRAFGERTIWPEPVVTKIVPSSAWTDGENDRYLLVDLPNFKENELTLKFDESESKITVSGERLVSDKTKIIRFEQKFDLPSNSDSAKISGTFEGEVLYVKVPKRAIEEEENISGNSTHEQIVDGTTQSLNNNNRDENAKADDEDHVQLQGCGDRKDKNSKVDSFSGELLEKWGRKPSQMDRAIKILMRNKGIVFTAVVAFSLGFMIARNFGSASRPGICPI